MKQDGKSGARVPRFLAWGLIGLAVCLLVAAIVPQFFRIHDRAPVAACRSNLKNIGAGLEMYARDWGGHYPSHLDQLVPKYLKDLPECYEAGRMTYRAEFGPDASGNVEHKEHYFVVECAGDAHRDSGLPSNYPKYDSVNGLVESRRHEPSR